MPKSARIILSVICMLCLIINYGCRKKEGEIKGSPRVTLTYSNWETLPEQVAAIKAIISAFEERYPNIKINYQRAERIEKILIQIAGNAAPDIFFWNWQRLSPLVEKGVIIDLKPYMDNDKGFKVDDYFPTTVELLRYGDGIYGLPIHTSPYTCFYNKTMFDNSGLKYPDDNWTWDDYLDAAKKLTQDLDNDGRIDQYGIYQHAELWAMPDQREISYFNKEGTKCIVDSPEWRQMIQYVVDLGLKHKVIVPLVSGERLTDISTTFSSQRVGMFISGTYWIPQLITMCKRFEWGIAPIPKFKEGKSTNLVGSLFHSVSESCKYPEEAWKFIRFYSEKGKKIKSVYVKGNVPAYIPAAESEAFTSPPPGNMAMLVDITRKAKPKWLHPAYTEFQEKIFRNEYEKALLGIQTVDEMVRKVTKAGDKFLKEYNEKNNQKSK